MNDVQFIDSLKLCCFACGKLQDTQIFFRCKECVQCFTCQRCFSRLARSSTHKADHLFSVVPPLLNKRRNVSLVAIGSMNSNKAPQTSQYGLEQEEMDLAGTISSMRNDDYHPKTEVKSKRGSESKAKRSDNLNSTTTTNAELIKIDPKFEFIKEMFCIMDAVDRVGVENWEAVGQCIGKPAIYCQQLFYEHVLKIDLKALHHEQQMASVGTHNTANSTVNSTTLDNTSNNPIVLEHGPTIRTLESRTAQILSYSTYSLMRDEYEVVFDNDYEQVIKNITIYPEEGVLGKASCLFSEKTLLKAIKPCVTSDEYKLIVSLTYKMLNFKVYFRLLERRQQYARLGKQLSLWNHRAYEQRAKKLVREERELYLHFQPMLKHIGQRAFGNLVHGLADYQRHYNSITESYKKKAQYALAKTIDKKADYHSAIDTIHTHIAATRPLYVHLIPPQPPSQHPNDNEDMYDDDQSIRSTHNDNNIEDQSIDHKSQSSKPVKQPTLFSLSPDMPRYDELDLDEREVCILCKLAPERYFHTKELILDLARENNNKLKLSIVRKNVKMDVNKSKKVFDLLISKKLIAREE